MPKRPEPVLSTRKIRPIYSHPINPKIAENSRFDFFLIFAKTFHTIRTKFSPSHFLHHTMVLCVLCCDHPSTIKPKLLGRALFIFSTSKETRSRYFCSLLAYRLQFSVLSYQCFVDKTVLAILQNHPFQPTENIFRLVVHFSGTAVLLALWFLTSYTHLPRSLCEHFSGDSTNLYILSCLVVSLSYCRCT